MPSDERHNFCLKGTHFLISPSKEQPPLSISVPIAKRSAQRYGNVGFNHRNGTLDRGLDTTHAMFVTLRTIRALALSSFLYLKIQTSFFHKTNVIEIVLSCFLIFKIKETKDYVTSPRAWTCDFLPPSWSVSYVISLHETLLPSIFFSGFSHPPPLSLPSSPVKSMHLVGTKK
jgi:hypothetical protein